MSLKEDRRSFLKKLTLSGFGATALPGLLTSKDTEDSNYSSKSKRSPNQQRDYNSAYFGEHLNHVAFPIGGIGAGMYCLDGNGAISHMSVRNRPEMFNDPATFGAISVRGVDNGAKVLEGPVPDWKKFGQPGSGNGNGGEIYGLPRFQHAEFKSRFPFGTVKLQDEDLPLDIEIKGWSPFIPSEEDDSSLPVGALEYTLHNTGNRKIESVFSFHSENFIQENTRDGTVRPISNGFVLTQGGEKTNNKPHFKGDFAVFTDQSNTVVDHHWFRGGWWDPLTMVWNYIENGKMNDSDPIDEGAPGASLYIPVTLSAGERKTIRIYTAWYVPLTDMRIGEDVEIEKSCSAEEACCPQSSFEGIDKSKPYDEDSTPLHYRPWYSSQFDDIYEVADYWRSQYDALKEKTELFTEAFYSSTLPAEVQEAVAANLSILKSTTVMRQHDGRLWNWEGSTDDSGCCHGSCTHVWNYAQAIPHLFPKLERSLRHTEFCESQNKEGHQKFRAHLPIRPADHDFYAASDGQLGGIMKVYREWRVSGDNKWLEAMYPLVEQSMNYCIKTWDPKHKGILEEPHHNTYDIEFWGPDGMCTSFYLGALQAITKMGSFLQRDVSLYKSLYQKGKKYIEQELFNGEYFIQKIQTEGLEAEGPVESANKGIHRSGYSDEALELLKKEGPKYQYGNGCLSDGILGGWIARAAGMEDPVDPEKTRSHLNAIHKYNLKQDLTDHANPQRPAYALGDEGGVLLCTWPRGGELSLPFVYSKEVWTGIEYQVASHLMMMGEVEKGLEIVRTCRDRYDGTIRNPFNEIECGNFYARALASYGLLQGLTGARYDAVEEKLYIDSKIGDFTSFLSTEKGFGTVTLKNGTPHLKVYYGDIPAKEAVVSGQTKELKVTSI